jgi:hypothetical protein
MEYDEIIKGTKSGIRFELLHEKISRVSSAQTMESGDLIQKACLSNGILMGIDASHSFGAK